jgi:hypothetical protein
MIQHNSSVPAAAMCSTGVQYLMEYQDPCRLISRSLIMEPFLLRVYLTM